MDPQPHLLFAQEISGHLARIWEYEDGRFLFDWLQATGKGITVFCTSFDEALRLWEGIRRDVLGAEDVAEEAGNLGAEMAPA